VWIIPVFGKRPASEGWQNYGASPPTDEQIEQWIREYPDCGIGLVCCGLWVGLDIDISAEKCRSAGHNLRDAERLAPQLVREVREIAFRVARPTGFRRQGLPPKEALYYGAVDEVPTMAGAAVEVFCTVSSKQMVADGFHPEAITEYQWLGTHQPIIHPFSSLPPITAEQAIAFRAEALELCAQHGLVSSRPAGAPRSPSSPGYSALSGIVSDFMRDVLRTMGATYWVDRRETAANYFARAVEGEKHYVMTAVVGALIISGFDDDQIIAALEPTYRQIVHDDPSCANLRKNPMRVRAGMAARGADVVPLSELDRIFGPAWSASS
jgi:hypothetical protein